MKKIYLISTFIIATLVSCDVLDVDPQHSIPADGAVNNRTDAIRALNGCYDSFQAAGYYGRNYNAAGDLSSDILSWSGTTAGYNQMDNNSILPDNVIVEGIWSSIYRALNRINSLKERLPEVEGFEDNEKQEIQGELHFLRALAHYDLARMFGGVPVRTSSATADEDDLNKPRNEVSEVFQSVFDDLEVARQNISSEIIRGRASLAAVLALEARANLHYYSITHEDKYLDAALNAASSVIDDFGLELEQDFAYLFSGNENRESIFEIEYNEQDRNRLAEYFFPTDISGRYEFAPDSVLLADFPEDDLRFSASIGFLDDEPYVLKYNDIETGTDNVYVFRLAEMYLIYAEASLLKGDDPVEIRQYLNPMVERAGLDEVTSDDYEELREEIAQQRRLEFAFEGHRWFDLVRTGQALEVLEGVTDNYQTLFPIPLNEILANDAINDEDQNPGY